MYGTTPFGGSSDLGTVFKIDDAGTFTSLHSFEYGSVGFNYLVGGSSASVTFVESDGTLYGATGKTAFKIDGAGTFTALPAFEDQSEVPPNTCIPPASTSGPVVRGSDGALYGISTRHCESAVVSWYHSDTLYRIENSGAVTPLHTFSDTSWGGWSLVLGSDGALYGTTESGGSAGRGSVFRVDDAGDFTILHSFNITDGMIPRALVLGSDGALYGTTTDGGSSNHGTIFRIDGTGDFNSLHSFSGNDGAVPYPDLVLGGDGALYGITNAGGSSDWGTVFRIDGAGTFTSLHSFNPTDGYDTDTSLVIGSDGAFYGTLGSGGPDGGGVVYRIPEPVQGAQLGASAVALALFMRLRRRRTSLRELREER